MFGFWINDRLQIVNGSDAQQWLMHHTCGAIGGLFNSTVSLRQKVSVAFGKALEADLPGVFLRSDANPRALLTLGSGSFCKHFALWT